MVWSVSTSNVDGKFKFTVKHSDGIFKTNPKDVSHPEIIFSASRECDGYLDEMNVQIEGSEIIHPNYDENVKRTFTVFFVKFEETCEVDSCGSSCTQAFTVIENSSSTHNNFGDSQVVINDEHKEPLNINPAESIYVKFDNHAYKLNGIGGFEIFEIEEVIIPPSPVNIDTILNKYYPVTKGDDPRIFAIIFQKLANSGDPVYVYYIIDIIDISNYKIINNIDNNIIKIINNNNEIPLDFEIEGYKIKQSSGVEFLEVKTVGRGKYYQAVVSFNEKNYNILLYINPINFIFIERPVVVKIHEGVNIFCSAFRTKNIKCYFQGINI